MLGLAGTQARAAGAPPYFGFVQYASTGTANLYLSGKICLATSSNTAGICTILMNPFTGAITATSFNGTFSGAVSSAAYASQAAQFVSTPTLATSGYVALGAGIAGNVIPGRVDPVAVASSTNPVQSGGVFTQFATKASSGTNADISALNGTGASGPSFPNGFTATTSTPSAHASA